MCCTSCLESLCFLVFCLLVLMELAIKYYGNVPPNWHHHFVIFSMSSSTVPFSWKQANVCAVHKKDDKSCVNNYRPISLLCCVEKVFERLIFKRLFSFLQENNVLTSFGFIPGDSSVNQLTFLYNVFCKALTTDYRSDRCFSRLVKHLIGSGTKVSYTNLSLQAFPANYFYGSKTT